MRKPLLVLVVCALVCALAAGCDTDGSPYAARVHGTSISSGSLQAMLKAIAGGTTSRCLFAGEALKGAGAQTYSMDFSATVLTFMVERQLAEREVARLRLPATPLAVETASYLLEQALSGSCAPSGSSVTAALPAPFRGLLSGYEVTQALLAAHLAGTRLTGASIAAYARAHPLATSVACVSEILVSSKQAAASVLAKYRAGTSFAALARAHSLDTSTAKLGGSLGCTIPVDFSSPYPGVVAHLATGAVSAPVVVESPYLAILKVTSRKPANTLDVALTAASAGSSGLAKLADRLGRNGVTIDPAYGRWVRGDTGYNVVAPKGPASKDLSNLAALTPRAPTASASGT